MNEKKFRKIIKMIRDERNNDGIAVRADFPKAMMTGRQIGKNTATVNCGGDWCARRPEVTRKLAELVVNDPRFVEFIEEENAHAYIERTAAGVYQVRVNYNTNTKTGVENTASKSEATQTATAGKKHMTRAEIARRSAENELAKLEARLERQTKRLETTTERAEKYGVIDWSNEYHYEWLQNVETDGMWIKNHDDIMKNGAWNDYTSARRDIERTMRDIEKAKERVAKTQA